jgi:hypothetical protein
MQKGYDDRVRPQVQNKPDISPRLDALLTIEATPPAPALDRLPMSTLPLAGEHQFVCLPARAHLVIRLGPEEAGGLPVPSALREDLEDVLRAPTALRRGVVWSPREE